MNRRARVLIAVVLGGGLLLVCLAWPGPVVRNVLVPVATVLWLLLRLFVLSIDQHVYWWGIVAVAAMVAVAAALIRVPSGRPSYGAVLAPPGDPARRWRDSLRLGIHSDPVHDAFRREAAWMLSSFYASQRPGFAAYQIREALVDGRISIPRPVHDFLFSATRPVPPRPPFFRDPRAWVRLTRQSVRAALRAAADRRGRGASRYLQSVSAVLDFMEQSQEKNHEL